MQLYEIVFGLGLSLCIFACAGLSIIGLRNSVWFGKHKSSLSKLEPIDIKIVKISAFIFLVGVFFFFIGFWLR